MHCRLEKKAAKRRTTRLIHAQLCEQIQRPIGAFTMGGDIQPLLALLLVLNLHRSKQRPHRAA